MSEMKLVFIYGTAAAGKFSVAKELAALTGLPLFHNHLVVDAVASVFPFGSDTFVALRERFWLTVFQAAVAEHRSLIFTFQPEATVAPDFTARVRAMIEGAGGCVVLVRLVVPPAEQERRIANADRAQHGKLRSLDLLRSLRDQFNASERLMPPPALTVDTSLVEPTMAAQRIRDLLATT